METGPRRITLLEAQLQAAHRITCALFESPDPDEVIGRALRTAVDVLDAEGGSLLLADSQAHTLVFRLSVGVNAVPAGTTIPWDSGIAGAVYRSAEPTLVADAVRDARHYKGIDAMTASVTRDIIVAPLRRWDGSTVGVMEILNKRQGAFDAGDLELLGVVADISATAIERARLHEEARLAELARLFGDVAHDVKNLLVPVVAGADIIGEALRALGTGANADDDRSRRNFERCRWVVDTLEVSARRAQERLKQISDCIHGASVKPRFAPCRIGPLVADVFGALKTVALQRGVTLAARDLDALPAIGADDGLLFNAIYNLVNNAIPEVPPGGSVTVSGVPDPGRGGVLISVADTGGGMPPDVVERLFSGHVASRKRLGSGLGSRIVKNAVEAHGGSIEVVSAVGAGTTFRIFLPTVPPAP